MKSFKQQNRVWIVSVFVFIVILGFNFDIKTKWLELNQEITTEKTLQNQLNDENNLVNHQVQIRNRWVEFRNKMNPYLRFDDKANVASEWMSVLLKMSEASGLVIQSVQPDSWQTVASVNTLVIHLVATGSFLQFVNFIADLSQYSLPISLIDFNVHEALNDVVQIEMQLQGQFVPTSESNLHLITMWNVALNHVAESGNRDPFVIHLTSLNELSNQNDAGKTELRSVSVQQLKYVGFLQLQNRSWGMVMLPNGKTIDVEYGDVLGLENAKVIFLNEDELFVEMKGVKTKLTMQ